MHRNLHFPVIIFILIVLPLRVAAQITRDPIQQNSQIDNIAPLPANVNPEGIIPPDPSEGEKIQSKNLNSGSQTKRLVPKSDPGAAIQRTGNQMPATDKYGNPAISRTPEEKTTIGETAPTAPANHPQDNIIYLDLQVTATPESPQIQIFQGTERLPKTTSVKTEETAPAEKTMPVNDQRSSSIGKVSFLKQYAAELKSQIEKNKNNANYPLAEKQQELSELENLLKGE